MAIKHQEVHFNSSKREDMINQKSKIQNKLITPDSLT